MKKFYLSANGDDADPGCRYRPWKTVSRVNAASFEPGSKILFRRGEIFTGARLNIGFSGRPKKPIVYSSYGSGLPPILKPDSGDQVVRIAERHDVTLGGLLFDGDNERKDVIKIWDSHHIKIKNSEIKGAQKQGILLLAWNSDQDPNNSGHN